MADFELLVKNIGPHDLLSFESNDSKVNHGIYGRNGQGKTFISRCFRMFSYTDEETNIHMSRLLKYGEKKAKFTFRTKDKEATFEINNGVLSRKNTMNRIFYVFNADYVNENLSINNYQPDGRIEGAILGKADIDLSAEKELLKKMIDRGKTLKDILEEEIDKMKQEVKSIGVSANMNAYKNITYDNLKKCDLSEESFEKAKLSFSKLSNVPDDLSNINVVTLDIDCMFFKEISELLSKEFTLSQLEEDFCNYAKDNLNFIESGISIYNENKSICPFCKSKVNETSLDVIHKYTEFLEDSEARVSKQILNYNKQIINFENAINSLMKDCQRAKGEIGVYANYFEIETKIDFSEIQMLHDELVKSIKIQNDCLQEKRENISISINLDYHNTIGLFENLEKIIANLNEEVMNFNQHKNNISQLKTNAKQEICLQALNKLRISNDDKLNEIKVLTEQIYSKRDEIKNTEMTISYDKRTLISENLEKYINSYFHGKYVFNKNTFEISLGDINLGHDADFVLSDGEKSALAFAHYLANVHSLITNVEDYQNLIFIIDDPISSMDYQFVYEIISSIKFLKVDLQIDHFRMLLLTHNLEFFSSIIRNKLIRYSMILQNQCLIKVSEELIMPYELHLNDIWNVVHGESVTHTIPNSIRHIIETICQFEGRKKSIDNFILENKEFTDKEYIYSLIHDLSHGNLRYDISYTDEQVRDACKAIISFIERKYKDQLPTA